MLAAEGSTPATPAGIVTAKVFAALGDATRLNLVALLCAGSALLIAQLTASTEISRQGVNKHLQVLADAGVFAISSMAASGSGSWNPRRPVNPTLGLRTAQQHGRRAAKLMLASHRYPPRSHHGRQSPDRSSARTSSTLDALMGMSR